MSRIHSINCRNDLRKPVVRITAHSTKTEGKCEDLDSRQQGPFRLLICLFTLESFSRSIVCYFHTFGNNLGIKRKFAKYFKESCCLSSDQHFSFKCFKKKCFCKENISKIVRPLLAAMSVNGLMFARPRRKADGMASLKWETDKLYVYPVNDDTLHKSLSLCIHELETGKRTCQNILGHTTFPLCCGLSDHPLDT